jgi:hypothetical protein
MNAANDRLPAIFAAEWGARFWANTGVIRYISIEMHHFRSRACRNSVIDPSETLASGSFAVSKIAPA